MKKSILYILLIFTILFISCNCESSKKLKDYVIYDGVLYCYLGEDTTVEIPSYYYQDGKKTKITKISEGAFSNTCVKNVILGRHIEIIDDYAFYDSDITSIKLNKNVKSIGEKAFYNIGIKFLNGDNNDLSKCINLENIGTYAFGNGIEGLILPEGIDCISLLSDSRTIVPSYCNVYKNGFYIGTKDNPYEYLVGFSSYEDFYLHKDAKKIYDECPNEIIIEENANYKKVNGSIYEVSNNKLVYAEFEDNTELVLDETVKIIGTLSYNGFDVNERYKSITIPDNVETLEKGIINMAGFGMKAFVDKVFIGKNVKEIHPETFNNIFVNEYIVSDDNPYYKSNDGVIYSKDGKVLIKAPDLREVEELTIIDGCEKINDYALIYNRYETINFPDTLVEVGDYAVAYSHNLKKINQKTPLKKLGEGSFLGGLFEKVELDDSIKILPKGVFYLCSKLHDINLPNELVFISANALNSIDCKSIYLPDSVVYIMRRGIVVVDSTVTIGANVRFIHNEQFGYNSKIIISNENKNYYVDNNMVYQKKDE